MVNPVLSSRSRCRCCWPFAAPLAVLLAACASVPAGFDTPESVLHDTDADVYLVSNINGEPLAKDGNGYIARVSTDRETMERYWIQGGRNGVTLHAPKGMAIAGDLLWVADIDVLRAFDRRSGAPVREVPIPGASFLNDVSADAQGTVFCSDTGVDAKFAPTGTDAIWRVPPDGAPVALAKGTELGQPNGIVARDGGVYAVSWRDGAFYQIDRRGVRLDLGKAPQAKLDGLVRVESAEPGTAPAWYATSWDGKCVYRFDVAGGVVPLPHTIEQPADCGFDGKRRVLLVPWFGANKIDALPL
jgi:sugar lactone lactonase YvrE